MHSLHSFFNIESLHLILIIVLQSRHSVCLVACLAKERESFWRQEEEGSNYRLLLPCHLPALFLLINDLMALVNIIRNACTVGVRKFWLWSLSTFWNIYLFSLNYFSFILIFPVLLRATRMKTYSLSSSLAEQRMLTSNSICKLNCKPSLS